MEVWIRIKPEEETKMLLQNTKVIFEVNYVAVVVHEGLLWAIDLIKTIEILTKMILQL